MEKVIVTVELTENNYSAYLEKLPGCISTGKTFEELKKNISEAIDFHLEGMRNDGESIPIEIPYELTFKFNTENLLQHYNGIFTNSSLERLTGINQRQLQRYASGVNKPRKDQSLKIKNGLHKLGKELIAVEL
jgi:predicted RNase H-like HicB family nuclease